MPDGSLLVDNWAHNYACYGPYDHNPALRGKMMLVTFTLSIEHHNGWWGSDWVHVDIINVRDHLCRSLDAHVPLHDNCAITAICAAVNATHPTPPVTGRSAFFFAFH